MQLLWSVLSHGDSHLAKTAASLRCHRVFWLAVTAFVMSAVIVNPFRETPLGDDWAYSLTVKNLLLTGRYDSHDFLLPNMPFQAYWGALFATVGGYSFSMLRLSTLTLALTGLIAFYYLARHHELHPDAAGIAVLALLASPLFFQLSYSFFTDVPFLTCWIVALLAYSAGIARGRPMLMLIGGVVGAAAILIRQFGVALVPALAGVWMLESHRRARLPLYSLGILPLLGAACWQFWSGLVNTHWGALLARSAQARYLAEPGEVFLQLLWRPAAVLHYLALFSLALLPIVALTICTSLKEMFLSRSDGVTADRSIAVLIAAYLTGVTVLGHLALNIPLLMPYLPWAFSQVSESRFASAGLTALTFLGAAYLTWVLYLRYRGRDRPTAPQHWLIDFATFVLLLQHLMFYKMGDRYLLDLLPLALIALTRHLRGSLGARLPLALVSGLVVLMGSVVWTRGILAYQDARWQAAESARLSGISPAMVYGPWTWIFYYRFPEFLADIQHRVPDNQSQSMFGEWLPAQKQRAQYHVIVSRTPLPSNLWEVKRDVPFRDIAFRRSHAYLVRRLAASEPPPAK